MGAEILRVTEVMVTEVLVTDSMLYLALTDSWNNMPWTGIRLPEKLENSLIDPCFESAYQSCLDLEHELEQKVQKVAATTVNRFELETLKHNIIFCRIPGYLLHHAPNDQARLQVLQEILSCRGKDVKLLGLGELYYNHFIRPCTSHLTGVLLGHLTDCSVRHQEQDRPRTPPPKCFPDIGGLTKYLLKGVPKSYTTAKRHVSSEQHSSHHFTNSCLILRPLFGTVCDVLYLVSMIIQHVCITMSYVPKSNRKGAQ